MIAQLANHNADIKLLIDKGYALSIDSNYLVVRDVPFLDNLGALQTGAIVSTIVFIDKLKIRQQDHQIFFCGSHPHEIDGQSIKNMGGGPVSIPLSSEDLLVQRSFSNKPPTGSFADWYEKIESYITIISGPAMEKYNVNPYTFREVEESLDSVFHFRDTLTSKAEIGELSTRLEGDTVAIVGLGGTGSYLLDFLVKTPVAEIRGFDGDWFQVHNAFRSPGRLTEEELGKRKSEVYTDRYKNFRGRINISSNYVTCDSEQDFRGVSFAFVCIDSGSSRLEVFNLLIKLKIPFIDVGMGLDKDSGLISGTLRTTYFPPESAQEILDKNLVPLTDIPDDVYKSNIQMSELNALNASLAMIKYKQVKGFYDDDNNYYHQLFDIDSSNLVGEDGKD